MTRKQLIWPRTWSINKEGHAGEIDLCRAVSGKETQWKQINIISAFRSRERRRNNKPAFYAGSLFILYSYTNMYSATACLNIVFSCAHVVYGLRNKNIIIFLMVPLWNFMGLLNGVFSLSQTIIFPWLRKTLMLVNKSGNANNSFIFEHCVEIELQFIVMVESYGLASLHVLRLYYCICKIIWYYDLYIE